MPLLYPDCLERVTKAIKVLTFYLIFGVRVKTNWIEKVRLWPIAVILNEVNQVARCAR